MKDYKCIFSEREYDDFWIVCLLKQRKEFTFKDYKKAVSFYSEQKEKVKHVKLIKREITKTKTVNEYTRYDSNKEQI